MAEQPSGNRRSSARLKFKEDVFAPTTSEISKLSGTIKPTQSTTKSSSTRTKRKIDYDENDNGFKFTRSKPKRVKATATIVQDVTQTHDEITEEKSTSRRKSRRKSPETGPEHDLERAATISNAQTRSLDDKQHQTLKVQPDVVQRKTRTSPRKHGLNINPSQIEDVPEPSIEDTAPNEPTKIALPFADTPVIRRNKEMRKGNTQARRSSLSMRGRRASSLIDSGTSSALPHEEVETADFYKHIEGSILEPRRMRQLLVWCGSRAMGDKPSFATEDSEVKLAAWQIQQELFKEFSSKNELSDWFSREETSSQPLTLKPNPRNLANLAKIDELEAKLKALRAEQQQWARLQQPPSTKELAIAPLPPIEKLSLATLPQSTISKSSPSLRSLLKTKSTSAQEISTSVHHRLERIKTDFELNLDKLLDSVNRIGQHLAAAERTSKRVLSSVARVLDEKDRLVLDRDGRVGTMDTLRALTRVIDRN